MIGRCICDKEKEWRTNNLVSGKVKSCGCKSHYLMSKNSASYKHGDANKRLYKIWTGIKQRCSNPNIPKFHLYGGKGIKICDEWKNDYINFKNWALNNNYKDNLSIDRIDSNKNYYPENCRWVTLRENGLAHITSRDLKIKKLTEENAQLKQEISQLRNEIN